MARPIGQLEKSLAALTIGVRLGERQRERATSDGVLTEWEQQIQLPLRGKAGSAAAHVDKMIGFDVAFVRAPQQRLTDWGGPQPHFSYGIEFTSVHKDAIFITASVVGWKINDFNWCVGARMRFQVFAPSVTKQVPYSAVAHLVFQGFGGFAEGEELQP
jgi:hypothetical protein